MPARRASLAGERGIDLLHPAGCLVYQALAQQPPARPQDLAVEPGLGAHIPAWISGGAPCRAGHLADLQVLDADHIKAARDVSTGLFGPVLAPIGLASAHPGNAQPYLPAAVRATPGAGELALQAPQPPPLPRAQAEHVQQLTCRQRSADSYAAVDTDDLTVAGCQDGVGNCGKSHMPASGPIHGHPIRPHCRRHRAGPAKPDPSDLGHPDFAYVTGQAAHIPLPATLSHNAESLILPGLAPRGSPGQVLRVKERGHRPGEVPQCLLLYRVGSVGEPRVLCPGLGELPTLFQVARRARPAWTPVRVLLDREVPYVPGVSTVLAQGYLLVGRGTQPIPRHTNTLAITADISREVKRRFLPGLTAGLPRRDAYDHD